MRILHVLIFCGLAQSTTLAAPVVRTVCASGCDYSNLQTAINAAQGGWILVLKAGETYSTATGFTLPAHAGTGWVEIRSNRLGELPAGRRVFPSDAPKMPRVCVSGGASNQVFETELTSSYWKLAGLEITLCGTGQANSGSLIQLGNTLVEVGPEQVSHHFVIDRCYIHGNPITNGNADAGPWRGIMHNANDVTIINSYIDEIHPTIISGSEGQGLTGWSFSRNLSVKNNFISASTINSLVGGASAPFQGHFPMFLEYIGNHYKKHPHYSTDNYHSNPAGEVLPSDNNIRGQTFHKTDTDELYIWTTATGGAWRKVTRPFNSPVCFEGRKWRNLANDTIWDCVNGRWQAGGADIMSPSLARTSTSVTAGNPTQIFFSMGSSSMEWASNMYVQITGATGEQWSNLNGRWKMQRIDGNRITVPLNSANYPTFSGKITVTPQFRQWPIKNLWELKKGIGARLDGNLLEYSMWPTTGNQKGVSMLLNWTPNSDGPATTLQDIWVLNNKIRNNTAGVVLGSVQWDNVSSNVVMGNPTRVNGLYNQIPTGSSVNIENGAGTWAAINGKWPITRINSTDFTIPFNSTGFPALTQPLRFYDETLHFRHRWPRRVYIVNNLWESMAPGAAVTMSDGYATQSDNGGSFYSGDIGRPFLWSFPEGLVWHNTVIKPHNGPQTRFEGSFMPFWFRVANQNNQPAKDSEPVRVTARDNIFEDGRFLAYGGEVGCDGTVSKYWALGDFARNVNIQSAQAPVNTNDYNDYCSNWGAWPWGRSGMSFKVGVSSAVVSYDTAACPATAKKLVLTFSGSHGLQPGTPFRITASNPQDIQGDYVMPANTTNTATTVTVCTSAPDRSYTVSGITSAVDFVDYNAGNFRLASSSQYKGWATDGGDPGADQNVVEWSTEGAESGAPNPYLDFRIKSVQPTPDGAVIRFLAYSDAPCSIQVSGSRAYASSLGLVTQVRTGRYGEATVTGLGPMATRWAKITCDGKYREIEFVTAAAAQP